MLLFTVIVESAWYLILGEVKVSVDIELFDTIGGYCVGQD